MRPTTNNQQPTTLRVGLLIFLLVVGCWLLIGASVVRAQSVDILMQAGTYTPPFYKGAPKWSNQSLVSLTAVVTGVDNPSSLNYKWIDNITVLGRTNGVGKNTLVFFDSILGNTQRIHMQVFNSNDEMLAKNSIIFAPTKTETLVYEDNPLYGLMLHKEVSSGHTLKGSEGSFAVFPLFFSTANRLMGIDYSWRTNNGDSQTLNTVTYRIPPGTSGSSVVTVKADNPSKILQSSEMRFVVKFEN
jgi:hypothetical protein